MSDPTQSFRRHLRQHEFELLEEDWLALLEADSSPADMMDLAELAARYAPAAVSVTLLRVLGDWFDEKQEHRRRLRVLRQLVELGADGSELELALADCYRAIHADYLPLVERLLQQAGLGFGAELSDALAAIDGYVKLLPGTVVVDAEVGPARVKKLDLLLNRALICDRDGREVTLDLTAAVNRTRPTEPDGFFELLLTDPAGLKVRAAKNPGRLVRSLLLDLRQPQSAQAIKRQLTGIVPDDTWDGFWNRARRELENDPHIVSVTRPTRGYQWSDLPVEKKPGRSSPTHAHRSVFSEGSLGRMSHSELLKQFRARKTFADRRQLIELVEAERPDDAADILAGFFCTGSDNRARNLIEERLRALPGAAWTLLLGRVLTSYRQMPEAFSWMAINAARLEGVEFRAVLTRLLDLLESPDFRRFAAGLRKTLAADNYRLVAESLSEYTLDTARRLIERLGRVHGLEAFRQGEIAALVYEQFPDLKSPTHENATLTTEAGLARARAELENLTGRELPRAAEELAAARAHGDLSENYEYKAAKEKQARLMGQVKRLQASLARTRVITAEEVDTSRVSVGCRVRIADAAGVISEYALLGPWDSDPDHGVISYLAPLSTAMLGRRVGDTFEFDRGLYTVQEITNSLAAAATRATAPVKHGP